MLKGNSSPDGGSAAFRAPRDLSSLQWAALLAFVNIGYFLVQVSLSTNTFFYIGSSVSWNRWHVVGACVLMLAQAACVFLRTRPVLLFSLVVVVQFALTLLVNDRNSVVGVLLLFAVYNLTMRTRLRVWLTVLVVATVVDYSMQLAVDDVFRFPNPINRTYFFTGLAVQVVLNYAVAVAPGLLVSTYQKESALTLRYAQAVEQQQTSQVEAALAAERVSMARELHDVAANQVSGVQLQINAALSTARSDPEATAERLLSARAEGRRAMQSLREMVGILREAAPEDSASVDSLGQLPRLIEALRESSSQIDLTVRGDVDNLSPIVSMACFRIVEESLANARKHAPGSATSVTIERNLREVRIGVRNTPAAAATDPDVTPGGWGVVGMRERATILGGTLSSEPTDDGGWVTRAVIPLERPVDM